jgi:hypothetical protein
MARDWDKELAKIDKQISTMSDDDLARGATPPSPQSEPASQPARAGSGIAPDVARPVGVWGVYFRVGLAVALAVSVPFWPYASRCGLGLGGYLASVAVLVGAGGWAALTTWRSRMGRAHVLALTVIAWGLSLAAVEVLPRVGYAKDPARSTWTCQ